MTSDRERDLTPEQRAERRHQDARLAVHFQLHRLFARGDPVRIKPESGHWERSMTKSPDHGDTELDPKATSSSGSQPLGTCELTHGFASYCDTGYEVIDEIEARRRRKLWMALDSLKAEKEAAHDIVVQHARFHTTQERAADEIGASVKTVNELWQFGLDFIIGEIVKAS